MASKKDLTQAIETMAEDLAVHHGATIKVKRIKVGGRETDSRVAEGGMFDLDAARGILMHALSTHREALVTHMPTKGKAGGGGGVNASGPANDGSGPRIGPDGRTYTGAPENGAAVKN